MIKEISVPLFDLLFQRTDSSDGAIIERVVKVNGPQLNGFYGDGTHYETWYYRETNESAANLFYQMIGVARINAQPPYHINALKQFDGILIEFYIDTDNPVDVSNKFITCVKMLSQANLIKRIREKPIFVSSVFTGMIVDMINAVRDKSYEVVYWGCSIDRKICPEHIVISGRCTENTVKIYLNNSQWLSERTYDFEDIKMP